MEEVLADRQQLLEDYNEMVDYYNHWLAQPPSANRTYQLNFSYGRLQSYTERIREIDDFLANYVEVTDPQSRPVSPDVEEGADEPVQPTRPPSPEDPSGTGKKKQKKLPTAKGVPKTEKAWKQLAPPEFTRRDEFWKDPAYRTLQGYALSDADIKQALKTDKVHIYAPDLYNVDKIEDLFDKKGRAVILYLTTSPSSGHWVGLLKKGDTIHYFDPYGGLRPDGERVWLSNEKLKELDQKEPRLSQLLAKSKYKVTYNPYAYQSNEMNNNTCGRHVIARLFYHNLSEPEYRKMILKSGLDPDEFVIRLTHKLIGK